MSAGVIATVLRRRRTWLLLLLSLMTVVGAALLHTPGPKGPPPPRCHAVEPPPPQIAEPQPVPVPVPAREPAPWVAEDAFFLQIVGDRVYWNGNNGLWSARLDRTDRPTHHVAGWVLTFVVEGEYATYTTGHEIRRVRVDRPLGTYETLVTEWEDPVDLASDGKHLYYTMFKGSAVMRAGWRGGESAELVRGGPHYNVAVDDSYLYVVEYRKKGRVVRYSKRNGEWKVLASGIKRPVGVAQDADYIYFPVEGDGSLRRVPKRGGRMETIAEHQVNHDILAVDETYVYWGDWGTHRLVRARKDGSGEMQVLAEDKRSICGIAVNDHYIAFTTEGRLEIIPKP